MKEWLNRFSPNLVEQAVAWGGRILIAGIILLAGWWLARRLSRALQNLLRRRRLDNILVSFLGNLLYIALALAVLIAALDQLGIKTTSLLALLGAAGLAIGLALKDSLGNLASGVMLVALRPFGDGDFIEAAGVSGTVCRVGLFSTVLLTPDRREIVIPNATITAASIVNYTAHANRRIDLVIGVSYSDNLKLARDTIAATLAAHPKVLKEPEPQVMILDLADSSVNIAARPWVALDDYWTVRGELLEQIKTALESAGCSIPFPQRDIHLEKV